MFLPLLHSNTHQGMILDWMSLYLHILNYRFIPAISFQESLLSFFKKQKLFITFTFIQYECLPWPCIHMGVAIFLHIYRYVRVNVSAMDWALEFQGMPIANWVLSIAVFHVCFLIHTWRHLSHYWTIITFS